MAVSADIIYTHGSQCRWLECSSGTQSPPAKHGFDAYACAEGPSPYYTLLGRALLSTKAPAPKKVGVISKGKLTATSHCRIDKGYRASKFLILTETLPMAIQSVCHILSARHDACRSFRLLAVVRRMEVGRGPRGATFPCQPARTWCPSTT